MRFPNAKILVFAKAPIPGQVKTRLIPRLGARGAALLYERLLRQVVSGLIGGELCPVQCWCAPDTSHPLFEEFESRFEIELKTQSGVNLGERMLGAASCAFGGSDAVVLVGGDCPELGPDYVREALRQLGNGVDAVLGPAQDGGYVLLGLSRVSPKLFLNIPWGSRHVLAETRQRLADLEWRWHELEALWDVDRPEDLDRLLTH